MILELPIVDKLPAILKQVNNHRYVIVEGETGSGKSTQVVQALIDAGYDVIATQPRILATQALASYVAEQRGGKCGDEIGYRYGKQSETERSGLYSDITRCLFVTDGLALVAEQIKLALLSRRLGPRRQLVIVVDEAHEWNRNIEILLAWLRREIARGLNIKVVVMSATIDTVPLAKYLHNAPVISVPGRTFPVTEITNEDRYGQPIWRYSAEAAVDMLSAGLNVLVFEAGKGEIADTIAKIYDLAKRRDDLSAYHVMALHADLTPEEQRQVFIHPGVPTCVVATNVAQTSITIDYIDVVIDMGMERRIELAGGIEGLYLRATSLADMRQRMGRAARTKPGFYINLCKVAAADRLKYPVPEILRTLLAQTVLRLIASGVNPEELEFYHQPKPAEFAQARKTLLALSCIGWDNRITELGRTVASLPISVHFGCMIMKAVELGVADDVIKIAAIFELGGIIDRKGPWRYLVSEQRSDALAQLAVFRAAASMQRSEMAERGIFTKAYFLALEKRSRLSDSLKDKVKTLESTGRREDILKAVCAGMVDHLYHKQRNGTYTQTGGRVRQLARDSVVNRTGRDAIARLPEWVVAQPLDLDINDKTGRVQTLELLTAVTITDPTIMAEVAPHLVSVESLNKRPGRRGAIVVDKTTSFNGQPFRVEAVVLR